MSPLILELVVKAFVGIFHLICLLINGDSFSLAFVDDGEDWTPQFEGYSLPSSRELVDDRSDAVLSAITLSAEACMTQGALRSTKTLRKASN